MRGIVISGLSGSGKTAAIKVLEDLGYFCVDNLPVPLLKPFLDLSAQSTEEIQKLAIVIDARNRAYIGLLPETLALLKGQGHEVELVFLNASDEVLVRRFSETRRKHPLEPNGSVTEGVRRERELLEPLLRDADQVFDTTEMKTADLKAHLVKRYGTTRDRQSLAVQIVSFGFKFGLPLNADLVLDVRFLPNPFFREDLKAQTGADVSVVQFVMSQADTKELLKEYERLLRFLLPRYDREGKGYLTLAVGCTGGRHRSVVIARKVLEFCEKMGFAASIRHRDMDRD